MTTVDETEQENELLRAKLLSIQRIMHRWVEGKASSGDALLIIAQRVRDGNFEPKA